MSDVPPQPPKPPGEGEESVDKGFFTLKSEAGKEYGVKADDYNIAEKANDTEANVANASGPKFDNVAVYWTVGSSGYPSQDVQNKTAITWYKLEKAPLLSWFQYTLTINCNDTYDYKFTDQEPDTYGLSVWSNSGTHYVSYRSSAPTIVKISGS